MSKVTINDSVGIKVSSDGSGLQVDTPVTLASSPTQTVSAVTAAATLTAGGVYTLSSSGGFTAVMPLASNVPGSVFVFRTLSAQAHVLTGSQESSGTRVFCNLNIAITVL